MIDKNIDNSPLNSHLGTLYLVPSPLDFGMDTPECLDIAIPHHTQEIAARISHWICENAKSTRAYLNRIAVSIPLQVPLQMQKMTELPREIHKKGDHLANFDASPLLSSALLGHDMGLMCEAGMPAIADPGSSVVRAAHEMGLAVAPLVGPNSLMLALAASGMNGQNFAFVGYVPTQPAEREKRLRGLDALAHHSGQTQILIETPYRNQALLSSLIQTLKPETRLAIASGLTLATMKCRSASISKWMRERWTLDNNTPCVFLIGK